MAKIYGYARCSTNEDKQDIDRQKRELKSAGVPEENIYLEYGSGIKTDRVQLNRLLDIVSQGDTIVTTEVSRLTRSTKQLCDILETVKNKQIKLDIKNSIPIDYRNGDADPMSKAFMQMAGVFAELERNIISERVKSGMANAKAKGKVVGRPKTNADNIPDKFYKYYARYKNKEINVTELAKLCEMSRTTVYKYIDILENK